MSDSCASGCTGETAVGNDRNGVSQTHSEQSAGESKHLSHAGAALGAFITDNDDVARIDLAIVDSLDCRLFLIEDTCRSLVDHHLRQNACDLTDRSLLSKVAVDNSECAGL